MLLLLLLLLLLGVLTSVLIPQIKVLELAKSDFNAQGNSEETDSCVA
jgi:hypothetical protein